jgi:two-component system, NtrC family, sensor kinase
LIAWVHASWSPELHWHEVKSSDIRAGMNWYTINYGLGTSTSLLLGFFVLYRGEGRELTRKTWFFLCVFVSLWHAGKFIIQIAQSELIAQSAAYVIYLAAVLIPPSYLHFILALLGDERRHIAILSTSYFFAAVELVLLFSGWLIEGVRYYPNLGFYELPGGLYWLYLANYIIVPSFALVKLILAFHRTDIVVKRNQLKYVISSSLIGFLSGATSFFPFIMNGVPPVGAPLVYFYTLPITYAVARYRLMDIDVVIKKSLIYALLLLSLLIPSYLIVIWGQKLAFDTINYTFSMVTLALLIMVGFVFPKVRFRTEEALERALFQKRVDYRETLLRSSREMVSIIDFENLSNSLVKTVSRALGTETASFYLLDEAKGVYNLTANIGREKELYPKMLSKSDPLIQRLTGSQGGIVKEELEMAQDKIFGLRVAEKMSELEAEISVPITSKERLIGILNLGHKEGKEIYSSEDLELLSTLTNQAAIAIENARLYENLKQSQDTLRRADRLSSLGLLTAGLAHEIRNPLVAIRTFTQLLPERYDDADFREGFQGLALKEVDRICGLINDLLSFARPSRPNVAEENMNDVVDGIARILETEAKEKAVEIKRDFALNLPRVWIDREQMKQVFMNLILNAIQAMGEGGSIFISTRLTSRNDTGHAGQFVQVEVRDTGVGIPPENLDHIFDPFFTSKEEGSGLGLSISHQIVQEHGGYVTVESKVGAGTTFFINLPIGKPIRRLSNGHAHANEANLSH